MKGSTITFLLLLVTATANSQTYIGLSSGLRLDVIHQFTFPNSYLSLNLGSRILKRNIIDFELGYNSLAYRDIEKKEFSRFDKPSITKILTDEIFFNTIFRHRFYSLHFQSNSNDSIQIYAVIGANNNIALNQKVYRIISGSPVLYEDVESMFFRGSSLILGFSIDFEKSKFRYSLIPTIVLPLYINHNYTISPFIYTIDLKLLASLKCNG